MTKAPKESSASSRKTDPRVARSRAAVLAAALDLLAERGVAGTTIEAISERSGVAKTTIYRKWAGQPALVLDAFASVVRMPPQTNTGSIRGDLDELMGGLAAALGGGPGASLMAALMDAAQRDATFAALHRAEAAFRHGPVRHAIERGVARGELAAWTDPAEVVDLLAGPMFYRRLVSGEDVDAAFTARVIDSVLAAYAP